MFEYIVNNILEYTRVLYKSVEEKDHTLEGKFYYVFAL